jgi:adenylosuccinate lyase
VSDKELLDLKKHENNISIERILEIEQETSHDVVAAIREFAEKARIGGGKLHLGATSMDIVDNADIVRTHEALKIIEAKLISILHLFAEKIETYASTPCIGFTHLQPHEVIHLLSCNTLFPL